VSFHAAGFARADGAHGRRDNQNAAGAQAFLYAESAARSKPAAALVYLLRRLEPHRHKDSGALSPGLRIAKQNSFVRKTDAQLRTTWPHQVLKNSCNLLSNNEVMHNWLRSSIFCIRARGAGVRACSIPSNTAQKLASSFLQVYVSKQLIGFVRQ
jgi:hypothetical protein